MPEYDIFVLFQKFHFNTQDLIKILTNHYELNVYPKLFDINGFDDLLQKMKNFADEYFDESLNEKKIKESKLILHVLTYEFNLDDPLIDFAKSIGKPIIPVIIEENTDQDEWEQWLSRDYDYFCDIYKNRVLENNYDPCMWLGKKFNKLIDNIGYHLNKNLKVNLIAEYYFGKL